MWHSPSTSPGEPCIEPDPKSIQVIEYQGFLIPICQLTLAEPDACLEPELYCDKQGVEPPTCACIDNPDILCERDDGCGCIQRSYGILPARGIGTASC